MNLRGGVMLNGKENQIKKAGYQLRLKVGWTCLDYWEMWVEFQTFICVRENDVSVEIFILRHHNYTSREQEDIF